MGLKALSLLGLKYPARAGTLHILGKLIETRLNLRGKSDDDIVNLPETRTPRSFPLEGSSTHFLLSFIPTLPQLAPLVFMDLVISLSNMGFFELSPFGFVTFGFILSAALGDIAGGERFGKLAMRLVDKLKTPQAKAIAYLYQGTALQHWTEPLRNTIPLLEDGYSAGLAIGNFTDASNLLLIQGLPCLFCRNPFGAA